MYPFISEYVGTTLLVFFGLSIGASSTLTGSLFKGAGNVYVAVGWGIIVSIISMLFVRSSGAYFNPAVTLGLAINGSLNWYYVPYYIICQLCGAFTGAILVWIFYNKQLNMTKNPETILKVFVTGPEKPHILRDIFCEAIGTMILLICSTNIPPTSVTQGLNGVYFSFIIMGVTYSMAGVTGLALNPARDLMPRIVHSIVPIKHKKGSQWSYAIVTIVGPLIGATTGAFIGNWISSFPIVTLS